MLAEGLGCSTEWLRFGGPASSDMHREIAAIALDYELMPAIAALTKPRTKPSSAVKALERAERP